MFMRMKECMTTKSLFLKEGLSRDDLARELQTNRTYLTAALRHNRISFAQFVNSYRATYAIDILFRKDEEFLGVEDLAVRCGFGSSRVMNRYIKKSAGLNTCALRIKVFGKAD